GGCDERAADAIARRLRDALAEPFTIAGMHLTMSASIGIAVATEEHRRPEDVLRDADAAMYGAKDAGRDRHHGFTPDLRARARERLEIAGGLRRAMRKR